MSNSWSLVCLFLMAEANNSKTEAFYKKYMDATTVSILGAGGKFEGDSCELHYPNYSVITVWGHVFGQCTHYRGLLVALLGMGLKHDSAKIRAASVVTARVLSSSGMTCLKEICNNVLSSNSNVVRCNLFKNEIDQIAKLLKITNVNTNKHSSERV
eukprot:GHVR01048965.1.p1 GENE.GHVR01048965.1~~GHVR01048965.1.p1  ORF type:complete len:156 (+),score=14.04 GHVR01048965.1:466-933(+)